MDDRECLEMLISMRKARLGNTIDYLICTKQEVQEIEAAALQHAISRLQQQPKQEVVENVRRVLKNIFCITPPCPTIGRCEDFECVTQALEELKKFLKGE